HALDRRRSRRRVARRARRRDVRRPAPGFGGVARGAALGEAPVLAVTRTPGLRRAVLERQPRQGAAREARLPRDLAALHRRPRDPAAGTGGRGSLPLRLGEPDRARRRADLQLILGKELLARAALGGRVLRVLAPRALRLLGLELDDRDGLAVRRREVLVR